MCITQAQHMCIIIIVLYHAHIHITTLFELILMADKEQTTYHYQSKSQTNPDVYLLDYKKSPKLKTLKP